MGSVISAVVFDLDGLLIDSEPLQLAAWDRYLARFGAALTPQLLNRILGLRLVDSAVVVVEALDLPVQPEEVVRDRDAIFLAAVPGAIAAMKGARELIAEVRTLGLHTALATSGHRRYVDLALESAGLTGMFDVEVTGELVTRGKPAPDVYLRAAELLHLSPAACLALEDAPNGVRSALAAGMRCYAVPLPDIDAESVAGADAVLESLDAVVPTMRAAGWI
jgi:pseudouridine-5'-monophosphatase